MEYLLGHSGIKEIKELYSDNYLNITENYYASAILNMVNDCKDYIKVSRFKKDTEVMEIKLSA